jgi:hypothetical protein
MGIGIKRLDSLKMGLDPVLTSLAQKYENPSFVSSIILPDVSVEKATGKYPIFGKESMQIYDSTRNLKSPVKEMPFDEISEGSFSLTEYALETVIDYLEEESAKEIFDIESYHTESLMDSLYLAKEYKAVQLLTNTSNYASGHVTTLESGSEFSDPDADPIAVLRDSMEVIRNKTNQLPNVLLLGHPTFVALQSHPKIIENIKYSQLGIVTEDLIAAMLSTNTNKVKVAVGTGMYHDRLNSTFVDLWGDVAILAYNKKLGGATSKYEQSYGKCFVKTGYPAVKRSTDRNEILKYITAFMMYGHEVTHKEAGYLIKNTVA